MKKDNKDMKVELEKSYDKSIQPEPKVVKKVHTEVVQNPPKR